jgi:hypothetical protein
MSFGACSEKLPCRPVSIIIQKISVSIAQEHKIILILFLEKQILKYNIWNGAML